MRWLERLRQGQFLKHVFFSYGGQILQVGITLPTNILLTRVMGPSGRGTLAVAVTLFQTLAALLDLGFSMSFIRSRSEKASSTGQLLANAILVALLLGAVGGLGLLTVRQFWPERVPVSGPFLVACLILLPFNLLYTLLAATMRGGQQFREMMTYDVSCRLISFLSQLGLALTGYLNPLTAYWTSLGGAVPMGILLWVSLARECNTPIRPSPDLLRGNLGYGLRGYVGFVQWTAMLSFDLFLVDGYLGKEAAGLYSICLLLSNLLMFLPKSISEVLFSRIAGNMTDAQRWSQTVKALRWTLAGMTLLTLFAAAGSGLIGAVFGPKFALAAPAFRLLLPGLICLAGVLVSSQFLGAIGSPPISLVHGAVCLVLKIWLNTLWLPKYGVVGASMASSLVNFLWMLSTLGISRYQVYVRGRENL